jgi:hypothetical protein
MRETKTYENVKTTTLQDTEPCSLVEAEFCLHHQVADDNDSTHI